MDDGKTFETSQAYGINDVGEIVGFRYPNQGGCLNEALFWSSSTAKPTVLPWGPPAVALELNEAQDRQAVGVDNEFNLGLLWENASGSSGSWTGFDLNNLACTAGWIIRQGHGINDSEWIVAVGQDNRNGNGERHTYLLYPCPADTDGNFQVDVDDLVNTNTLCWGTDGIDCPDPGDMSDVNCDGIVDVDDRDQVILDWGCCPGLPCCQELQQMAAFQLQMAEAGLYWPDDYLDTVNAITTGSPAEAEQYACWFAHYMTGACTLPNCSGAGSSNPDGICPYPDPFGGH